MYKDLGQPLATFRPTARHIWRFVLGLFAGVSLFGTVLNVMRGHPVSSIARGLFWAAAVLAVLAAVLVATVGLLGITVYADGIRGRTKWGLRTFIRWSDISEIAVDNDSGMVFVIIGARGGKPDIWTVPDLLQDPELQRLVTGLAGQNSPLLVGVRAL